MERYRNIKNGVKVGRIISFGGKIVKKYEYVNLKIGKVFSSKSKEHRKIIDEYAAKGYRYVGYIPTKIDVYGKMDNIDLIFEMEIEKELSEREW